MNGGGSGFLDRIYTTEEQAYCRGRIPQLASRFAAKEAVMKALGTGIRGVGWKDIQVTRSRGGPPAIVLHARGAARAERMGVTQGGYQPVPLPGIRRGLRSDERG